MWPGSPEKLLTCSSRVLHASRAFLPPLEPKTNMFEVVFWVLGGLLGPCLLSLRGMLLRGSTYAGPTVQVTLVFVCQRCSHILGIQMSAAGMQAVRAPLCRAPY